MSRFSALLLLMLMLGLTACAGGIAPSDGLGGTGQRVADGFGGTGQKLADGIGGTGQRIEDGIGGTGIVGTVTDFGSIWIRHAHVHFEEATPVTQNGRATNIHAFRLGQVVAVLSDPVKKGYHARSIDIVFEVVGPVAAIDHSARQLTVLNQKIVLDKETLIVSAVGEGLKLADISPQQFVQVSGLRKADGSIIASRIDVIAPQSQVQLVGKLVGNSLSGQPVNVAQGLVFNAEDERLLVSGRLQDGVLIVDEISRDAILNVVDQATELLMEGFLFDQGFDGDIVVGGIELVMPGEFDLGSYFDFDDPVFIDAELGQDDMFYTEDFMFLPDGADEYMDFYPDGGDWIDSDSWIDEVIE